jgi:hypothetical protein
VLEQLLGRFSPYIRNLPTGHGKGHLLRDLVNLTTILQDPDISKYDSVEIFVGMIGGAFHDIGNSVITRHDEPQRFSGHAEVGAYLFGEVAADLLPENLRKMVQLSIAAHTHYLRPITITKGDESRVKETYDDEVIDGSKIALWIARQADRLDIQGPIHGIRHILTKADPTEDLGEDGEFHKVFGNEAADFVHQFSPQMRTGEQRKFAPSPAEKTARVLEHLLMYARSALVPSPYSVYDSDHYQTLIRSLATAQLNFIIETSSETPIMQTEEQEQAITSFLQLCEKVEPAENTPETVESLKTKFSLLSDENQSRWANGLRFFVQTLYPQMHSRVAAVLSADTGEVHDADPAAVEKVQKIIDTHLQPMATAIWENFAPDE